MTNLAVAEGNEMKTTHDGWGLYRRTGLSEMLPWQPGFDMVGVSISDADRQGGSPKSGDMIARNPKNHADRWLVAAKYFADNLEPVPSD